MINLSKSGNMIQYFFGLPNKPELVIDTPEDKVKKEVEGRGYFGIDFKQNKLLYFVSYHLHKDDTEERGVSVRVTKSNKYITEVWRDNSKPHFEEGMLKFITGDKYEQEYKMWTPPSGQ